METKPRNFKYELWDHNGTIVLLSVDDEEHKDEYFDDNSVLLHTFKAQNPVHASEIKNKYLKIGKYAEDLLEYECWVNKSKHRDCESVKFLPPTSRPRDFFVDIEQYECIRVVKAKNMQEAMKLFYSAMNLGTYKGKINKDI